MRSAVVAIVFICTLSLVGEARAQEPEPEAFARSYFAAMTRHDPATLAARMHPEALAQFRSAFLPLFEGASAPRAVEEILPLFQGVKTAEDLRSLSPESFFAAFQAGIAKVNPQFSTLMNQSRYDVLGHVMEKDQAHVVYRLQMDIPGQTASRVAVISLKKHGKSWGALLTTETENMAASLKRQFQ